MSTVSLSLNPPQKRYNPLSVLEPAKKLKTTETVKYWDEMRGFTQAVNVSFATSVFNAVYTLEAVRSIFSGHWHHSKPVYEALAEFMDTYDPSKLLLVSLPASSPPSRPPTPLCFFQHLLSSLDKESNCPKLPSPRYLRDKCPSLHSVFGNLTESEFRCLHCGSKFSSSAYTRNIDIQVSPEDEGSSTDLCLSKTVKTSLLTPENAMYCVKCGTERQHYRRISIKKTGTVVVVGVKRQNEFAQIGISETITIVAGEEEIIYRVQSVICRLVGAETGWYLSFIRHPFLENHWKCADYLSENCLRLADIPAGSAEVLFYTRS